MKNKVVLSTVLSVFTAVASLGFTLPAYAAGESLQGQNVKQDQSPAVDKETISQEKQCPAHHGKHHGSKGVYPIIKGSAKLLDMDKDALLQELKAGKTIAEIAKSKNMEPAALSEKLKAEITNKLDLAVIDGKMEQEKASTIKENLDKKINEVINQKFDETLKDHPPLPKEGENPPTKH